MEYTGTEIAGIIGALTALVATVIGGYKLYLNSVGRKVDRVEKQLKEAHEAAQARCHEENKALNARVVLLENRGHEESRSDQRVLLEAVRTNSEAFKMLAVRMPTGETTPPKGSRV